MLKRVMWTLHNHEEIITCNKSGLHLHVLSVATI